jgi:hypothetical protein
MGIDMIPLLVNSDSVPAEARAALREALTAPPAAHDEALLHAAKVLYRSTDLEKDEVRSLVGLPEPTCR